MECEQCCHPAGNISKLVVLVRCEWSVPPAMRIPIAEPLFKYGIAAEFMTPYTFREVMRLWFPSKIGLPYVPATSGRFVR